MSVHFILSKPMQGKYKFINSLMESKWKDKAICVLCEDAETDNQLEHGVTTIVRDYEQLGKASIRAMKLYTGAVLVIDCPSLITTSAPQASVKRNIDTFVSKIYPHTNGVDVYICLQANSEADIDTPTIMNWDSSWGIKKEVV